MSISLNPLPTREPQFFSAGSTTQWKRTFQDYPASTFTLHYVLRGPKVYTFDAVADGADFVATLESTQTAPWQAGLYLWGAYVTDALANQVAVPTVFSTLEVRPNLASNPPGADPRSFAARTLASLEGTIAALTNRQVASASVNGQSYSLANIGELFILRERLLSEVRREQAQARLNAGLGAANKIAIRFKPLTSGWPPSQRVPWQ